MGDAENSDFSVVFVLADGEESLIKVSAHQARALVVLAHTGLSADASDATAVRTVLALKGLDPPLKGHVVIELMDVDNRSIVELIGDPLVETVVSHDIIGRLMVREGVIVDPFVHFN